MTPLRVRDGAVARRSGEGGQIMPALAVLLIVLVAGGMTLFQVGRAGANRAEAVTAADAAALAGAEDVREQLLEQLSQRNYFDPKQVSVERAFRAAATYAQGNGGRLARDGFAYDPDELTVRVDLVSDAALDGDGGLPRTSGRRAPARATAKLEVTYFTGAPSRFSIGYNAPIAEIIFTIGEEMNVSDKCMLAAFEAAIVESGMRNLPYGHLDSLGVFQQRPSQGWGTPEQILDPRYAAAKFFQTCKTTPQNGTAGQLAQDVQRSLYPDRYDQVEPQARAALSRAASSSGDRGEGGGEDTTPGSGGADGSRPEGLFGPPSNLDVPQGMQPNATNLATAARREGFDGTMHGLGDRAIRSDHPKGLAVDLMVHSEKALGDDIAAWVLDNVDTFGVTYIIWYDRIATRAGGFQWRPYDHPGGPTSNPTLRHLDHPHVSVSGDPNAAGGPSSASFEVYLIE